MTIKEILDDLVENGDKWKFIHKTSTGRIILIRGNVKLSHWEGRSSLIISGNHILMKNIDQKLFDNVSGVVVKNRLEQLESKLLDSADLSNSIFRRVLRFLRLRT